MTFEQLQFFLAIVNNKTFTAAAEELYISQSSLSKCIKALEYELGSSLFVRGNKNVELTAAGQIFYNYAKRAEHNRLSMLNELTELVQYSKRTEISLGVLPIIDEMNIPSYITEFQTECLSSKAYINLIVGEQDELVKSLTDEKLNAAIVRSDELSPETFCNVKILQNELVFICSDSEKTLCGKETVELSELLEYPFIEFDKSSFLSRKIRQVFSAQRLIPRYTYSIKRHQQILSMVNAGYGIAIIPNDLIDIDRNPNIHIIRLAEPVYTSTSLVWLKNVPQNDVVLQLADFFSNRNLTQSDNR